MHNHANLLMKFKFILKARFYFLFGFNFAKRHSENRVFVLITYEIVLIRGQPRASESVLP